MQFRQAGVTLLILLLTFGGYSLLAVPWIEPLADAHRSRNSQAVTAPVSSLERLSSELARLFPEDAWERDRPKIVETEQGFLLFRDYTPLEDGRMELSPCSLVFYLGSASPERRGLPRGERRGERRPIVMLVPEGALLQFAGDADTTRGEFGRLVGGSLRGEVRLHAPETRPNAGDQIEATTHGVKIDEQRIWTPQRVDFRFGTSHGSGSDLTIGFAARVRSKSGGQLTPAVGGLASLRLEHLDHLHIEPLSPAESAASESRTANLEPRSLLSGYGLFQSKAKSPLEVTCQGPFQFDFEENTARFEESVLVERLVSDAVRDQLRCDDLLIAFQRRGNPTETEQEASARGALEPHRIIARGRPAVLQAPSVGASSRAEYLEYNLQTREFHLRDGTRAHLQHLRAQLETRELRYQFAEDPKRLGQALAEGPGLLTTSLIEEPGKTVTMAWQREMRIRPHEDLHLISLIEQVQFTSAALGTVKANELHVWVIENELAPTENDGQIGTETEIFWDIDRLLASRSVAIDSPRLTARTERLEAWVRRSEPTGRRLGGKQKEQGPPRLAAPRSDKPQGPGGDSAPFPAADARDGHVVLQAELLRLQLLQAGTEWLLEDLAAQRDVLFAHQNQGSTGPQERDLEIRGDVLEALDLVHGNGELTVSGRPAAVTTRGVRTTAADIRLTQSDNRLWIDGAGRMAFFAPPPEPPKGEILYRNQDLEQPQREPDPDVVVTWDQRLDFDGQRARFSNDVQIRGRTPQENGELYEWLAMGRSLDVKLARRVRFAATEGQPTPQIEQVAYRGMVFVEGKTTLAGQQLSLDQLQVDNLGLSQFRDQQPQRIHGDGPGWLSTVRYDDEHGAASRLVYLRVDFERALDGNAGLNKLDFSDRVLAVFGPVPSWSEELDPRRPELLGPRGAVIRCQQLSVADGGANRREAHALELSALGNVEVEAEQYRAHGQRVSYDRNKESLVLEGDPRSQAEIWKKPLKESTVPDVIARKITYRLRDGDIAVEGARRFDWVNPRSPPTQAVNPNSPRSKDPSTPRR